MPSDSGCFAPRGNEGKVFFFEKSKIPLFVVFQDGEVATEELELMLRYMGCLLATLFFECGTFAVSAPRHSAEGRGGQTRCRDVQLRHRELGGRFCQKASSNKCHASSNRCLTSNNKKTIRIRLNINLNY